MTTQTRLKPDSDPAPVRYVYTSVPGISPSSSLHVFVVFQSAGLTDQIRSGGAIKGNVFLYMEESSSLARPKEHVALWYHCAQPPLTSHLL